MMVAPQPPGHWTLAALLAGLAAPGPVPALPVSGLALDSRRVEPGNLFLACRGSGGHGLDHLRDALAAGAAAVAWEPVSGLDAVQAPVPAIAVPGLSQHVGEIAARFYGEPGAALLTTAVTGTNGKTSVTHMLAQLLAAASGRAAAVIGTLGSGPPAALEPSLGLTTPDAITLQRLLADFRASGIGAVAMEASSHALHQHRLDAVPLRAAVFTNLSRDHLDYHGDLDSYAGAKARLFAMPGLQLAVVNADDPVAPTMLAACAPGVHRIAVSRGRAAAPGTADTELRIEAARVDDAGLRFRLQAAGVHWDVAAPLLGAFNIDNLALALATIHGLQLDMSAAVRAAATLTPVAGRLERFGGTATLPLVIVDYAHTPAALAAALEAVIATGRRPVTCVFGCGGDRDRGKRAEMGAVARRADRVILTSDNPRSESPLAIIEAIRSGLGEHPDTRVIADRAEAIPAAIQASAPGGAVLLAGKGHENYQDIAGERLPFSDAAQVTAALRRYRP